MKKKISRKDKQTIQLVSIKEGLDRWSNLYENCVHKNLFHDKKWLSLYINSKDFYLCFISKGGLDIAAMPLSKERPFRMKIGGPIIRNTIQKMKLSKSIAYQKAIFENFAELILNKKLSYIDNWNYHFNYWYPLKWKGFNQENGYHFILDIKDKDKCWTNFETKIRTDIRKSNKKNIISKISTFESFEKIYFKTNQKNDLIKITLDFYKKIIEKTNGKVITAYLKEEILASIFFIEYKNCIYYLDSCNSKKEAIWMSKFKFMEFDPK